jgi:hypothetical protein
MKKTIFSILFIALIGFAFAGNEDNKSNPAPANAITLSGNVVDMSTGEALTGVEISVEGTDLKVYSDFDGNFEITNVKQGEYDIVASYISYKKSLVEDLKADHNQQITIKLQAD